MDIEPVGHSYEPIDILGASLEYSGTDFWVLEAEKTKSVHSTLCSLKTTSAEICN
jgi:hypothetical protein